jgi:hypothetical protein
MKIKYRLIYLIGISFALFGYENATDDLETILVQLKKYYINYPQEKIYIHFDKSIYAAGDSLWFKAYIVNAEGNQLSDLSKVLYVEFLDESDSLKQYLKLPIDAGLSWGKIIIPDTCKSGVYKIRAYTNWMRNFDADFYFNKTFSVGNALESQISSTINFHSELVNGKRDEVATITFQNSSGVPLSNSQVKWDVHLNDHTFKNSGVTGSNGSMDIRFPLSFKTIGQNYILANLSIGNGEKITKRFPIDLSAGDPDMQFLPEGGNILCGIKSKIAFKATDQKGIGIDITGAIVDDHEIKVAELKSGHAGMGCFSFTPQIGEKYKAKVKFSDGSERSYPLPLPQTSGYALSIVNDSTDRLKVRIICAPLQQGEGEIKVVAQMNGVIKYASKSKVVPGVLNAEIPKNRFSTGIVHFTLFSPQNIPVAERMIFINRTDNLNISVQTNKEVYRKREKVNLSLVVTDAKGIPVKGAFSVAVTDDSKIQSNDLEEKNILTELLLTSDLKGYIEQPNYYFSDFNTTKLRDLDILMMTQGWSRFVWKDILADKFPQKTFKPEHGLDITGKITGSSGKELAGARVSLNVLPGSKLIGETMTSQNGTFRFGDLLFSDTGKFLLLATDKKGNNSVNISVNETKPVPALLIKIHKNYSVNSKPDMEAGMKSYLKNSHEQFDNWEKLGLFKRVIALKEVSIKERKLSKIEEALKNSDNFNGPGNADKVITYMDLRNYHDLPSSLQGKIAGVVIRGSNGHQSAFARGYGAPMLIVVDGVPSLMQLDQIDVHSVLSIEVLKSGGYSAVYGIKGAGGVLVITTKRGGIDYDPSPASSNGFLYYNMKGYTLSKEFYSPVYPANNTREIKDLRTTLYWNPDVVTDGTGKANFEFYNADGSGKCRIVIEGLTADGKLGRQIANYIIK